MPEAHSLNPLLIIAIIFTAGYPAGILAKKIGIPKVTGNILAGILLGPSVTGVFSDTVAHDLESVTVFAMGLISVLVGGHLSYRRLHNSLGRVFAITLGEVAVTACLVITGTLWFGVDWSVALLLGAIAVETAPATVLAVVRDERAKGLLVKTLLASVALDNVLCIVLFSIMRAQVALNHVDASMAMRFLVPVMEILGSAVVGAVAAGVLLILVRKRLLESFTGLFLAILLACGVAKFFAFSPLLACLVLGVILGNAGRESENLIPSLENLEPLLLTCFFTLAGVEIDLKKLTVMGFLGAVYLGCRLSGKFIGGTAGAFLGTDLPRIRQNIAMSLLPHAGLAIGLVVILQADARIPAEVKSTITNVVLATVVLFEIAGPPLVRQSISRAGESHKDRKRIVEFLQEEHILTPLEAENKWDAIRTLAEFMLKSHGIKDVSVEDMVKSVEERERSISTAMGSGVAIPHAKIPSGPEIMGAMGICKGGIDFEAPDGQPVQFIIMVATPREHQQQHLQVMAAVARIISDPMVRAKLLVAPTAAAAYEAIESDLPEYYNYFLED